MDSMVSLPPPSYEAVLRSDLEKKNTVDKTEPAPAPQVDYGEDPLVTACRNNNLDFLNASSQLSRSINYLFSNKDEDSRLEESVSLLHVACDENNPQVVKLLLDQGADPNIKLPKSGLTPIELACDEQGDPEIVEILANCLFPHRLNVNAIHCVKSSDISADFTLLQLACRTQNVQAIKILLANQADPNAVAPGWSIPPLHLICSTKTVDSEIVNCLLEAKASTDTHYRGATALHLLCSNEQCNEQALRALLAGKADVNAVTQDGVTPFMLAIRNNTQMADLLLMDDRTDVNKADYQGWQAIHHAAKMGHVGMINTLIDRGVDINAKTNKGATPLHLAMLEKNEPEIFTLLEHGADASIKAPVNPFSRCELWDATFATCIITGALLTCLPITLLLSPSICGGWYAQMRNTPVHERCTSRYSQALSPGRCGVSPMDMADEGLRERMASRIITSQPESSPKDL